MVALRTICFWLAVLLSALLAAVPVASAQTITNTASAHWQLGGTPFTVNSNTVTVNVAAPPITIDTFVRAPGGPLTTPFTPSICGGGPINYPAGMGSSGSVDSLIQSNVFRAGEIVFFRLNAPLANTDPAVIDSLTAVLTTTAGDREQITIHETGVNTGIFMGAIPTSAIPPQPVQGDCRLSVNPGDHISIECLRTGNSSVIATARVDVLADPFGIVFDSEDGSPVSGARVTIVDALTGAPARIFADDGVTPWPSTVISGQDVTDAAGNVYHMQPGEYRFPLAYLGQYRLVIEPPAPYTAPSAATPAQLSSLRRPDGGPLMIVDASYGGSLTLSSPAPVRVDIPLDHPPVAVSLTKTASRPTALPGDVVFYTVTARNPDPIRTKRSVVLVDTPSTLLRLRPDSVRVDGAPNPAAVQIAPDGRSLTILLGDIAPGATRKVTYAMTVRADAPAGQALNKVTATDSRGISNTASAAVRIERDYLGARMTLIGRITDGGCLVDAPHNGIPGVRVVLEDGSFAITDAEGRYHFEGLVPGTHVVQALRNTLPKGGQLVDCANSTRSAGSANSRFVIGQGGSLIVADFSATLPEGSVVNSAISGEKGKVDATQVMSTTQKKADEVREAAERAAAGADTDWLAKGPGPIDFLFPAIDHNPRAPAIRVVIRHAPGQKVELKVGGKPVDPLSFDGSRTAPGGTHAVSIWRGIALPGEETLLTAVVRNADGSVAAELSRTVHYVSTPAQVQLLPELSKLVADGSSRPVLALRLLDRKGRPVHAGITGQFSLNAPYESAEAIDAMQSRALSGLGREAPRWIVKGDDGIAYVELAPTMVSGKLHMEFTFADQQQSRRQELEAWMVPGDQPWTLVGLAEGSIGARTVADNMERTGRFDSDLGDHARVALYAKGRVLGKFLLTMAYDSAKQRDDQRLAGVIDPRAYYTVFADGSDRRFDAASREKLYVRIEGKAFYALYGDFDTGFDQTQLARYLRSATGFKGEVSTGGFHAQGFAAKIAATHRRDEIQGGGITGPYRLSSRAIIANSEVVTLEVRDRFRSEVIVNRRTLTRFVDYDLDLLSGTISFKEPVLSRDVDLNPQFIVIDYEMDETARGGAINAGVRADYTTANGKLRVGASAITDTGSSLGGQERTNLAAVDLRAKINPSTEIRAEAGISRKAGENSQAWLVEAEHHSGKLDVLAYARQADEDFGVGQLNGAERGRRKVGLDARVTITPDLSVATSGWVDDSLTDGSRRIAIQASALYRTKNTDLRLGMAHFNDRLADGRTGKSTVAEAAVTQRFLNNKLEVTASTSLALDKAESVDLPERHRLTARYSLNSAVKLVGSYEIAKSDTVNARTAQGGVELTPWRGAKAVGVLGQQDISEYGKRSFAAFGLAQSIEVTKHLTLDATLDSSRTLSGFDANKLVNPDHPASSGGNLGENGSIAEDFTAITLGGTYRAGRWSATARGEWRDGQFADRKGFTFGAIRQLGEGSMVGSGFTWTKAESNSGMTSEVFDGALAAAHRPANSPFAFLAKLQYRADKVTNAVAGEAGPAGRTALMIDGDAVSRRLIGSVSTNWSPKGHDDDGNFYQRTEIGLFGAVRHSFDTFEGYDLKGTTLLGGLDARIGITDKFEIGGMATARWNLADHTTNFAFGPQIGFTPTKDVLLTVGYNISGFRDRDFSAARSTEKGLFATLRMKLDADTFSFLGLGE